MQGVSPKGGTLFFCPQKNIWEEPYEEMIDHAVMLCNGTFLRLRRCRLRADGR